MQLPWIVVIVSVPSMDTPVCDLETRKFNQEAAQLSEQVIVLAISMDLPFAQKTPISGSIMSIRDAG